MRAKAVTKATHRQAARRSPRRGRARLVLVPGGIALQDGGWDRFYSWAEIEVARLMLQAKRRSK